MERRLKAAEALWQRRGVRAYQLQVTWLGQLSTTSSVEVRPGEPPRAFRQRLVSGGPSGPGETVTPRWETVSGLFAWVRTLLRDQTEGHPWNPHPRPCGTFDVTFDPRDGHLRSLRYDAAFSVDDEHTLTVGPVLPLR